MRSAIFASACLLVTAGFSAPARGADAAGPRSAEAERTCFSLPEGFTAELVLAESEAPENTYGKFVALAFDARGRLWTTTALEYPLDGNENAEASRRLFAAGGRDKVLVIDEPCVERPAAPRVFADGLAIPLGVLPWRDGAFVQYGTEIRLYRDADGDGRAERHETVLEGFGVQDSHLFPHQFTRAPGGWILVAQGLFNRSTVRRPGGKAFADGGREVRFDACKLARFRPDGSAFELLTAGPNNIWGLTTSRTGQTWIQEANDQGYPIAPFEPGTLYRTGWPDRLRPYQPLCPAPLAPPQMGGTGLSGLALADDLDGWPAPWGASGSPDERIFYVANPITNQIQSIVASRAGGRFAYRKGANLLESTDPAFRPVAIQFGPDGCLYVVDWYNKVISHNEVPRNHPDRDRVRGRIWRIRHVSQGRRRPVVVAALPTAELPAHLGSPTARVADLAWQEIVDRNAGDLVPRLRAIAGDRRAAAGARCGALWSLEGLGAVTGAVLESLAEADEADLRREAIRVAATTCTEAEFRRLAAPLVADPSPRVRAAVGDALRRIPVSEPETIALIVSLGKERRGGDPWTVYDRDFERYLARWALELHRDQVAACLDAPANAALPVEQRVLATLALDPAVAAPALARLIPRLDRAPDDEEIRTLAARADDAEVAAALDRVLQNPAIRAAAIRSLLQVRTSLRTEPLGPIVTRALEKLLAPDATSDDRTLALEAAGAFRCRAVAPQVSALLGDAAASRELKRSAIRCLREMGGMTAAVGRMLRAATSADRALRNDALAAWAESRDPESCRAIMALWADLGINERQVVATTLARHREGARAIVTAIADDAVEPGELPLAVVADMRATLPKDPVLERLWQDMTASVLHVLRLPGADDGAAATVSLDGPFTVEAWVNLDRPIDNGDALLGGDALDMNFHAGRLRVWTRDHGDVVVAKSTASPNAWTHCAVTRTADGTFRIFIDGELDAEGTVRDASRCPDLRIGRSKARGAGTRGRLAEFRVWNRARTPDEIRADFDRSFVDAADRPASLVAVHGESAWGDVAGGARVEPAPDAPTLATAAVLAERAATFARFRALAAAGGDPARGKGVFAARCLTCHQQGGEGGRVGPALDGVGLTGTEAILRNVLTPSAAIEGGYRNFRVVTRDGRVLQGLLVSRDADAIVLRQPNTADVRVASSDVAQADFTSLSVMPAGILESMTAQEVSDLFAHLATLRQGQR